MTAGDPGEREQRPVHQQAQDSEQDFAVPPGVSLSRFESFVHVGPLPTPEMLKGYEEIAKDFPERLLAMSERQAAHRIAQESKLVEAQIADLRADRHERRMGQLFGLIIALGGFTVCGVSVAFDHPDVAKWIGTGTLLGLVTVMVTGRAFSGRTRRQDGDPADASDSQPTQEGHTS
ncbi:MAG: DUF2335 domain-containing protein [Phycisphaerales bacterium]|nr:MAG: DUF2335 domain-containing protein [Phycisphaerales bacterium]